jgi:lipoprotein-releasing system ATP-binding protein
MNSSLAVQAQVAGGGEAVIACRDLHKTYIGGDGGELHILRGVDLTVAPGESVAIIGKSGAGKSTLLHVMGALDAPSGGEVSVAGRDLGTLGGDDLARVRNRSIGFVFQFHHLLKEFTAEENVMLPAMMGGDTPEEARRKSVEILTAVGLASRLEHRPWQLSGGEQQRVAVARALVNRPRVLLADEPSGNLDEQTSERLHDLLFELQASRGLAMVLVTHNRELAIRAHRTLKLEEGGLHPVDAR